MTIVHNASSPNAIALLEGDHRVVGELLSAFDETDDVREKEVLGQRICKLLTVHAMIEEEILYPKAHEVLADDELVYEAQVEHASLKTLIAKIQELNAESEEFAATVTVLGEYVRLHVKEEEQEMFPKLMRTKLDLHEIGAALAKRRAELLAQMGLAAEPLPRIRADAAGTDGTDKRKAVRHRGKSKAGLGERVQS